MMDMPIPSYILIPTVSVTTQHELSSLHEFNSSPRSYQGEEEEEGVTKEGDDDDVSSVSFYYCRSPRPTPLSPPTMRMVRSESFGIEIGDTPPKQPLRRSGTRESTTTTSNTRERKTKAQSMPPRIPSRSPSRGRGGGGRRGGQFNQVWRSNSGSRHDGGNLIPSFPPHHQCTNCVIPQLSSSDRRRGDNLHPGTSPAA